MTNRARTTLSLIVSTAVGLSSAAIMFVPRGDAAAAPAPETFSAEVGGEVWRVNQLDLDMSGDPAQVDVGVGSVAAQLGSAAAPDRAWSIVHNVVAPTAPAGQVSAESTATGSQDTDGATAATGQAGSIPSTLDFGAATMAARSRWGGDESCLDQAVPLTSSKVINQGAGITPATIPDGTPPPTSSPSPTSIPTEIPTELPSEFPTELPTDLPTLDPTLPPTELPTDLPTTELPTDLPTTELPTDLPTTELPTELPTTELPTELPTTELPTELPTTELPTELPTTELPTELPTTELPTITLPPLPRSAPAAAEGEVSMATVAPATVEQRSYLEPSIEQYRRVAGEVVGKVADPSQPAMTFFGGEAELFVTGEAELSAYSNGSGNGSQVTWTPPQMALSVGGGEPVPVPTDGTALALPYSGNEDVVLTVSAGSLAAAESPTGQLAQAAASALDVIIKNGDTVVLNAELFPMSLKLVAPQGGIDCTQVAPVDPELKLRGKDNGPRADRLKANALPVAEGAKVKLFKIVDGERTRLKKGVRLNQKGDRRFKVKDRNGKKPTKYVVKVKATDLTAKDVAKRKVR